MIDFSTIILINTLNVKGPSLPLKRQVPPIRYKNQDCHFNNSSVGGLKAEDVDSTL